MPNFLLIGAEKAGTTSMRAYIDQHPQVYMSPKQGANFFSCGEMDLSGRYGYEPSTYMMSLEAYEGLFDSVRQEKAIGEASPSYLCHQRAAERIHHYLPDAKLIAILRQPAERAYSHFVFNRKGAWENLHDFQQALDAEEERIASGWHYRYHYRRNGYYYRQLRPYFQLFPREQLLVLLFDRVVADPLGALRTVFRFLEVADDFEPDTSLAYNVSGVPRHSAIEWMLRHGRPVRRFLERRLPPPLVSAVGRMLIRKAPADPGVLRHLTEAYREDIRQTQDLIGQSLRHWLERYELSLRHDPLPART